MKLIYWLTAIAFAGCLFALYAMLDERDAISNQHEREHELRHK